MNVCKYVLNYILYVRMYVCIQVNGTSFYGKTAREATEFIFNAESSLYVLLQSSAKAQRNVSYLLCLKQYILMSYDVIYCHSFIQLLRK